MPRVYLDAPLCCWRFACCKNKAIPEPPASSRAAMPAADFLFCKSDFRRTTWRWKISMSKPWWSYLGQFKAKDPPPRWQAGPRETRHNFACQTTFRKDGRTREPAIAPFSDHRTMILGSVDAEDHVLLTVTETMTVKISRWPIQRTCTWEG